MTLEEAQQKLNSQAQQLRDLAKNGSPDAQSKLNDLTGQVHDLQKQLEDAADKQAGGWPFPKRRPSARRTKAQGLADQNVEKDLHDMAQKGLDADKALGDAKKMEGLATMAAQGTMAAKPSAQDIAKLVNDLEESRANLARLAEKTGDAADRPGQGRAGSTRTRRSRQGPTRSAGTGRSRRGPGKRKRRSTPEKTRRWRRAWGGPERGQSLS